MQFIPSETLVIDRKRRVNSPFYDLDLRPPVERICDFGDVVIDFSPERAMVEAANFGFLEVIVTGGGSALHSLPGCGAMYDRLSHK